MMLTRLLSRVSWRNSFSYRLLSNSIEDEPSAVNLEKYSEEEMREPSGEDKPSPNRTKGRSWFLYQRIPEHVDPPQTSIILFPGQGSHYVGMGAKLVDNPDCKRVFEAANAQLNRNILKLCLEGPKDRLQLTVNSQLAIYITSMASLYKLRAEKPELLESCVAAAGFSVGEIAALVFAGSFTFEEGLHLVRVRADAMQRACNTVPSGMATVFLQPQSDLQKGMMAAREYCSSKLNIDQPVCQVAIKLYAETLVVAGHTQALDFLQTFAKEFKLRRVVRLPVSGAFHTSLMRPAFKPVKSALDLMDVTVPQISVLSNRYARPYTGVAMIRNELAKQVTCQSNWEGCLHALYSRPQGMSFPHTFEVGPGSQLGSMLKMVNRPAHQFYKSVEI